jgi:hypothetical protein
VDVRPFYRRTTGCVPPAGGACSLFCFLAGGVSPSREEKTMVRTEISLFLKNQPGELGKLAGLLAEEGINIDAITIQDASGYVKELFKARGKSLKRIASVASYNSMRKDSVEFALIRLLPADGMTNKAIDLLSRHDYIFDILPVIAIKLENRPGTLAETARKFGEEGININYVYGSVSGPDADCLFVFCPEDIDRASRIFREADDQ